MPKKKNSAEDNELLEEMLELTMDNDFEELSKLILKRAKHSLVEYDSNLGGCLASMITAINESNSDAKQEEIFLLAQKLIQLINVSEMTDYKDHYNLLGGVVNYSTSDSKSYASEIFRELIEAGFSVTHQVRDNGIPVKDILMFAAEQVGREKPKPDIAEIVRIILLTEKAPRMEGDLSKLALFMIDNNYISARELEEKKIFKNFEKMGKILEDFQTSTGASEEVCENIRIKLNTEYGANFIIDSCLIAKSSNYELDENSFIIGGFSEKPGHNYKEISDDSFLIGDLITKPSPTFYPLTQNSKENESRCCYCIIS